MAKELGRIQTFLWYFLTIFLIIRGMGISWFLSLFTQNDSALNTFILFIENDMYSFILSTTILVLIFWLGRTNNINRKMMNKVAGRDV